MVDSGVVVGIGVVGSVFIDFMRTGSSVAGFLVVIFRGTEGSEVVGFWVVGF